MDSVVRGAGIVFVESEPDALKYFLPERDKPIPPLQTETPSAPRAVHTRGKRHPFLSLRRTGPAIVNGIIRRLTALQQTHLPGRPVREIVTGFATGVIVGTVVVNSFGTRITAVRATSAEAAPATTPSSSLPSALVTTYVAPPAEVDATPAAVPARRDLAQGAVTAYRGGLSVDTHPTGATVFVNNERVGEAPLVLSSLPVGSRAVRVELNGYEPWSRSVRIVANRSTSISAHLEAARTVEESAD